MKNDDFKSGTRASPRFLRNENRFGLVGGDGFVAVVADRFMWATFQRFQRFFDVFVGLWLRVNVTCACVLVSREKLRRNLSAQIAVKASLVDVKCARRIQRLFAVSIRHVVSFFLLFWENPILRF